MSKLVKLIVASLCVVALNLYAGDIGFGTLKGVKLYDFGKNPRLLLIFNDDLQRADRSCAGQASFTFNEHSPEVIDRTMSIALSAYMANKKVRVFSDRDSCEANFISIQEAYF